MHPDATKIVAERESRTIVLTRSINASRREVFEAWTQPRHVTQWWDPTGLPLAECLIDLRPGGAFRFVNARSGGRDSFEGFYRELVPPERIVFERNGLLGIITFHEQEHRTRLVVTIECKTEEERDQLLKMGVAAGTARTLDNLSRYFP